MSGHRFLALAGALLLVACRSPERGLSGTLTEAQRDAIVRAVNDRRAGMVAAVEQLSFERVSRFFSDSPDAAFAGGGSMAPSRRLVLKRYREIFGALSSVDIDIGQSKTAVLAPDVAVITMQGRVTLADTAGRVQEAPFAWTMVWVQWGSEWKILHANQSYPLNIAP